MPPTTILRLKVGSVPVSLELANGSFAPQTLQRYKPFLNGSASRAAAGSAAGYRVALTRSAKVGSFPWQPQMKREGKGWTCRASDFSWDRSGRKASATIKSTDQALDSFLRTFYSNISADAEAQILHSAALSVGGKGYLFAGVSGAGKTTLSRRVEDEPGVSRLTDELAWVARAPAGFTVNATPFWGLFKAPERNGRAPLKKIFFLRKGRGGPRATPLNQREAQKRLMRCLVSFTSDGRKIEEGWDFVLEMTKRAPSFEFVWHKHDRPEKVIAAAEAA